MKKILYFVLIVLVLTSSISCSDDSNEPGSSNQLLLSKVSRNGVTMLEFMYDTEKNLVRSDSYSNDGVWYSYKLFEYNDKGIAESRIYLVDDHTMYGRATFLLDNFGRVSKTETYGYVSDYKTVSSETTLEYNPSWRLKQTLYQEVGESPSEMEEYTYDVANRLISRKQSINLNQPSEFVKRQTDFTPGDKSIPDHWRDDIMLVANFDDNIWEMFNTTIHRKVWVNKSTLSFEYQIQATEQEFNVKGYLIRQVLTRTDFPDEPGDPYEMTYEYTE